MLVKYGNDINMLLLNAFCISKKDKLFKVFSTECPKIYRKSVLHLLKYTNKLMSVSLKSTKCDYNKTWLSGFFRIRKTFSMFSTTFAIECGFPSFFLTYKTTWPLAAPLYKYQILSEIANARCNKVAEWYDPLLLPSPFEFQRSNFYFSTNNHK